MHHALLLVWSGDLETVSAMRVCSLCGWTKDGWSTLAPEIILTSL